MKRLSSHGKGKAKRIAKTGVRSFGGAIVLLLKIIGTFVLIGVTTGVIFACIFTVYVKTNFTSGLDVTLEAYKMNLSSVIYYKDQNSGSYKELVTLQSTEYRRWVDYADIPHYAEQALVAIEDKRFYTHNGVDWYRTLGAFGNMFLSMKDNFGGSTITQQLIKNLTEEDDVTVQRKLQEIFRALEFEKEYRKEEIIEWYLNKVPFGGTVYGLGAAANYYFGKDAEDLTLAECAAIVGITNNPSLYNPYISKENNKKRQELILDAMYEQHYILTEQELEAAKAQKLVFVKGTSKSTTHSVYTYFEDAVIEDVIADLQHVKDVSYKTAEDLLFTQGYKIYCTIDPDMQNKVDSIYQNRDAIPEVGGSTQLVQSAIIIADPATGHILAMEGGVGEKTISRGLNRATMSRRPPGSSIKPLAVYSPAIEFGKITPETRFEDSAQVTLKGTTWMPKNDDFSYSDSGIISIRSALIHSKNTVSAQILDQLTPAVSYDFMVNRLGFELSPYDEDYAPLSLGQLTNGATVREMAQGYTMLANSGVETHLITYTQLCDNNDNVIYNNKPKTSFAISPVTAYWVTDMLQDAVRYGTGSGAYLGDLMPVAGKTGSTSDWKDRWFCGYTPYYVAVVWTGFDTPANMKVSFNPASRIWKNVMTLVSEGMTYKEFPKPPDTYLTPIPGVDAPVKYVVRCVTTENEIIQETEKTGIPGRNITETAPVIDGYTLSGSSDKTITLSKNTDNNEFIFIYQSIAPSPSVEPSVEPSIEPTEEPSASPTESPEPTDTPPPTEIPLPSDYPPPIPPQ